jgi:uncharacterized protein (TIGR03437 family)
VLYAGGLGRTNPPQSAGALASSAAQVARKSELRLLFGGEPVPEVFYAGVTPGFAGLYQVNFRVPANAASARELRIVLGGRSSQLDLELPVAPPAGQLRLLR